MYTEIYHHLKKVLQKQGLSTAVGDEAVCAGFKSNEEALKVIARAVKRRLCVGKRYFICVRCGGYAEIYDEAKQTYFWKGKAKCFQVLK